ncbi:hypothetical protein [Dinghuibacter silviterrae]|nr:hypothetical protein [Dinghuibacter silviterrae]
MISKALIFIKYRMSGKGTFRIFAKEDGVTYKVSAIHLLNDGSFKVDVPYCPYEKGAIVKFPVRYADVEEIHSDSFIKAAISSARPQLSIHASGFVQFSGKGIISGIDSITGEIKGLGLQSKPLNRPVWSGPTFSISCWGLKIGFKIAKDIDEKGIFYDKEMFKNGLPLEAIQCLNTLTIEGWVLPFSDLNPESKIFSSDAGEMILASMPLGKNIVVRPMRVIRLKSIPCIIGLLPSYRFTDFGSRYEFGFILSSPGEKSSANDGTWYVMHAICPDFGNGQYPSLNYVPEMKIQGGRI